MTELDTSCLFITKLGTQTAWHTLGYIPEAGLSDELSNVNKAPVGDANSLAHALIERQGRATSYPMEHFSSWGRKQLGTRSH